MQITSAGRTKMNADMNRDVYIQVCWRHIDNRSDPSGQVRIIRWMEVMVISTEMMYLVIASLRNSATYDRALNKTKIKQN